MAREYFTNYYSLIQLIPRVELRFDLAESSRQTYTPKGFIKIKKPRETDDRYRQDAHNCVKNRKEEEAGA